jgi:hypothetical protein
MEAAVVVALDAVLLLAGLAVLFSPALLSHCSGGSTKAGVAPVALSNAIHERGRRENQKYSPHFAHLLSLLLL